MNEGERYCGVTDRRRQIVSRNLSHKTHPPNYNNENTHDSTCLGFQQLALLAAGTDSVLCSDCFDSEGTPLPLDLTAAGKKSALFGGMGAELLAAVQVENITENR